MSANPVNPTVGSAIDTVVKSMHGKYDGRGKWKRTAEHKRSKSNMGPKSHQNKKLSYRSAHAVVRQMDLIASLVDIYREAWERKSLTLCVQMQESARDRLFGKPFTAEAPSSKPPHTQDNRLQVAIQNLIVAQSPAKSGKGKKVKDVEAKQLSAPVIEAAVDSSEVVNDNDNAQAKVNGINNGNGT